MSGAPLLSTLGLPRPGSPPVPRVPVPVRWTLPNGLRVIAVPRHSLPHVAMRLVVPAGAVADPPALPGAAAMVAALLTEGTAGLSSDRLNERLDLLGASIGARVGHDFAEVDMATLSDTLEPAIELLAEVVLRPAFPDRETERTRAEALDSLVARLDEPANVADDVAAESVFGEDHPYGRLTTGTPEGVRALAREDLAAFHAARYRPDGSVLLVAGDFDPESIASVLQAAFGGWSGTVPPVVFPEPSGRGRRFGEMVTVEWEDAAQGEIRFAGPGMPRSSPDWIPAAVANYLIGGSTITGRLGANLREDKGWTYGIRSGFASALQAGGWVVDTAVDVEVVDAAVGEITQELERFTSEPVTEEELDRARQALILSLPRAFETPGRVIGRFATVEAYGLPHDYWERFPERVAAVTADEVLRIARAYFPVDGLVRVAVGVPR